MITFHPETISSLTIEKQIDCLLKALGKLNDVNFLFTMPNADFGNRVIKTKIKKFLKFKKLKSVYFYGTDQLFVGYEICMWCSRNSSSGIIENQVLTKVQ